MNYKVILEYEETYLHKDNWHYKNTDAVKLYLDFAPFKGLYIMNDAAGKQEVLDVIYLASEKAFLCKSRKIESNDLCGDLAYKLLYQK